MNTAHGIVRRYERRYSTSLAALVLCSAIPPLAGEVWIGRGFSYRVHCRCLFGVAESAVYFITRAGAHPFGVLYTVRMHSAARRILVRRARSTKRQRKASRRNTLQPLF